MTDIPSLHPLRLAAECVAKQDYERRLVELEAMAPMLDCLDDLMPALHARGVELMPSTLKWSSIGPKILVKHRPGSERAKRLLRALLDLGFVEIHQDVPDGTEGVTLRKEFVTLRLNLDSGGRIY